MSTASLNNEINDVYDASDSERLTVRLHFEITDTNSLLFTSELQVEREQDRLSPIRKISSDELLPIFILCSEEHWRSPLVLSAVCRDWRSIILSCPQAWQDLHLPDIPPSKIARMYLTRSQPLLLHMATPKINPSQQEWKESNLDIINQNSSRIECLGICTDELKFLTAPFPKLRRLHLATDTAPTMLKNLTSSRFPRLQVLGTQKFDDTDWHNEKIPPIEALFFFADYNLTWFKVLGLLEDTLVTLYIHFHELTYQPMQAGSLHLTQLKYLQISHSNSPGWTFKAKTPALRSYILHQPILGNSVDVNFELITHLDLGTETTDLSPYPALLHIRVTSLPVQIIKQLQEYPSRCPNLESIEYQVWSRSGRTPTQGSVERYIRGQLKVILVVESDYGFSWSINMPGQFPSSVSSPL